MLFLMRTVKLGAIFPRNWLGGGDWVRSAPAPPCPPPPPQHLPALVTEELAEQSRAAQSRVPGRGTRT